MGTNRRQDDPPQIRTYTFQQLLQARLTQAEAAASHAVEPLAHLPYEYELALKNGCFLELWRQHRLAGRPDPVLPSPCPRRYRTTTRRRAHYRAGRLQLGFDEAPDASSVFAESLLEPAEHTAIYCCLVEELSAPSYRAVAEHLNHAIIRGTYETFSVILNLDELNGGIVRRLKKLGQWLQTLPQPVLSAFVFCDPSRSDYYFEREAPHVPVRLKRLFGPSLFPLRLGGHRYALPPTSFTQVNESMIEPMLAAVRSLLQPEAGDRLLDLYCGYGLFAHHLGDTCAEVVGVDSDHGAIDAAVEHLRHHRPRGRVTFCRRDISSQTLEACLPSPDRGELVILDPPRSGADPGVIACLPHAGRCVRLMYSVASRPSPRPSPVGSGAAMTSPVACLWTCLPAHRTWRPWCCSSRSVEPLSRQRRDDLHTWGLYKRYYVDAVVGPIDRAAVPHFETVAVSLDEGLRAGGPTRAESNLGLL